jgi:hypothetical protein
MKIIFQLLCFSLICTSVLGQSVYKPKLVLAAYAHTTNNGVAYIPTDSGVLNYDSGYSYNTTTATYQFDTNFIYTFNPVSGYTRTILEVEKYDSNKNLLSDLTLRKDMLTAKWVDSFKYTYTYDNANNMLSITRQFIDPILYTWKNVSTHLYTYDAVTNDRLTDVYQTWVPASSVWQNVNIHSYTYDAKHSMLSDNYKFWDSARAYFLTPGTITNYSYDAMERISGISFQSASAPTFLYKTNKAYLYIYDAITSDLSIRITAIPSPFGGGGWQNTDSVLYTFDTAHNMVSENLKYYFYNDYTYDTSHNQISALTRTWQFTAPVHFAQRTRTKYTYNNDHQVTTYLYDTFEDTTGRWYPVYNYRYYYKAPPPPPVGPSGINTINNQPGSVKLYPSPANNMLNVDLNWQQEQGAVATIYDMQGKLYIQWQIETSLFSHSTIPVNQLPAGTYLLRISGHEQHLVEKFSVVR